MTDRPRLYLVLSSAPDPAAAAADLADLLDRLEVACVELGLPETADFAWLPAIDALRPVAQDRDVAFLLRDRPDLAVRTGCDGVRIASFADYRRARRAAGQAIVGVDAGLSRHEAMLAGEAEADFVALGPAEDGGPAGEFVEWWTGLMEVPGVAFGARGPQDAAALAAAGADFVALDLAAFVESGDVRTTIDALRRSLDA
jgi:thiamine-phosphate pyrophosphorylase